MAIASLDTALSGLKAARSALDIASTNIANASTPGYTRKILPQEALISSDGTSLGVRVQNIIRQVDQNLIRDVFRSNSQVNELSVQEAYLQRIQTFHGASDQEIAFSSELSALSDAFAQAANTPEDLTALNVTVNQSIALAQKVNDLSTLITNSRNEAQNELKLEIDQINSLLNSVAQLNSDIATQQVTGRSSAHLEDERDQILMQLSEKIDISYFGRENGQITVMTRNGQTLVDNTAREVKFDPQQLTPNSYYPGFGAAGIFVENTPADLDITLNDLGGTVGGLLKLRDETFPQYTAQLDEFAQKLAERFDQQGLRLFTDKLSNVPASVAPPGIVGYTGFAAELQVNEAIISDPTLLRSGTEGNTVQEGSNELLRKVVSFTFGAFSHEQATGSVDISAGTIFANVGLTQEARVAGTVDITNLMPLDSSPDITAPTSFTINNGATTQNITINPGDSATDLVNNINAAMGPGTARLNTLGQLMFESTNGNITLSDNGIGAAGMTALGHSFGVTNATNPSFQVQIGNENPITVEIAPTDTAADILATLNAIPNATASLDGSGNLVIAPTNGGDITLIEGQGNPAQGLGLSVVGVPHAAFRQDGLGASGTISTDLVSITSLEDFARAVVSIQSEDHATIARELESETVFFNSVEQRAQNQHGVDLDTEVAKLIEVQSAYSAAARVLTISEEMLDQLFASI